MPLNLSFLGNKMEEDSIYLLGSLKIEWDSGAETLSPDAGT